MRRLLALTLVLVLAACAPVAAPTAERDGQTVTINLTPTADLYAVTLSVLNAQTNDARCAVVGEARSDLGCALGDIPTGATVTVVVTGDPGAVECRFFAFLNTAFTSYRTFACEGR